MRSTNETKRLGLSPVDVKIISALRKYGQTNPTGLASHLEHTSRTTITYRLSLLLSRGWVERIQVSGHFEWRCSEAALRLVNENLVKNEITFNHYPLDQIASFFEVLFKDTSGERIYFLEPAAATVSLHTNLGNEFLNRMALLFKSGKNISEGVTSDALVGYIKKYDQQTLREMHGRMVVMHLVPDELLRFEDMFVVYKDLVYIINPQKDHVTEVRDVSFAHSMRSTIQALQHFGKKKNLNEEIEKLLK